MNPDESKSDQPTPEQLLKMLDIQIAAQRQKKKHTPARRALVLTVGLLAVMGGLLVAIVILLQMADDKREEARMLRQNAPATPVAR